MLLETRTPLSAHWGLFDESIVPFKTISDALSCDIEACLKVQRYVYSEREMMEAHCRDDVALAPRLLFGKWTRT